MLCGCSWSCYAHRSVPVSTYFVVFLSSHSLLAEKSCFVVCWSVTTVRNTSILRDCLPRNPNRRNSLKKIELKGSCLFFLYLETTPGPCVLTENTVLLLKATQNSKDTFNMGNVLLYVNYTIVNLIFKFYRENI